MNLKSLSSFRILFALFVLLFSMPSFSWIASVPEVYYNPPLISMANIFSTFPGKWFFLLLDLLVFCSLICLALGIKARLATLIFFITCLIGFNFHYSFGKIDHGAVLLLALVGCMAFSGWGRYLALVPDNKFRFDNAEKSLSLLGVLICFGMFTAGFEKANKWIDFDLSLNGFFSWWQDGYFRLDRNYLLAPYVQHFHPFILEFFDYSAVLFELSPLFFLLYSRKAWRGWLLIASIFHFSNILLLNINFMNHIVVYLIFVDFSWLYKKLEYVFYLLCFRQYRIIIISSLILIGFMFNYTDVFVFNFFSANILTLINLYLGIFLWSITIFLLGCSVFYKKKSGKLPEDNA